MKAKDLEHHPIITMTEGSALTRSFEGWASKQGLNVQRTVASNSLMAIVGLTIADVGISFLPEDYMRPWVERKALVALQIKPPLPPLDYCFLRRGDDKRAVVRVMMKSVAYEATFPAPVSFIEKVAKRL